MKNYTVWNFNEDLVNWDLVEPLQINEFPWYQSGKKQATVVKMAIRKDQLCILVNCEDTHSSAQITELNGSVYMDSCFEFFLTPNDQRGSAYLNFEINCCKTLHLGYGTDVEHRKLATLAQASKVKIESSILGRTKEERADDIGWQLTIEIPLDLIEELYLEPISKCKWFGNFYRCGGKTDPQYATWQGIESNQPAFHKPEQFGELLLRDFKNSIEN